jgi:hypothetical protein
MLPLVAGIVILVAASQTPSKTNAATQAKAAAAPAPPELYARALVADVNGDGDEDVVSAVGVDQLAANVDPNDPNIWGAKDGRFSAYVQAVSGKTGAVLYTLGDYGGTYVSTGTKPETRTRTVLALREKKLVVARVAAASTTFEIVDASTGKQLRKATAGALSGAGCDAQAGLWFESQTVGEGVVLDVNSGTVTPTVHPSECTGAATATIAGAPIAEGILNRGQWKPFFGDEVKIPSGKYAGVTAHARNGLAVLVDTKKKPAASVSGPTVTYGDVGAESGGDDNGLISIVGVDASTGDVRWERSLAALGLVKETVDRVDIGPTGGPIVFLRGEGGFVALFPKTGLARFRLPLPEKTILAQYTLSERDVVLHVFAYQDSVFSFLSKRLASRYLVADYTTGQYLKSFPDGPLAPHVDLPKPPFTAAGYSAVSGCTCPVPNDGADAAAAPLVQLLYYIRSTTESGGHKRFGATFAFDVDAKPFALPHYDEKRERIVPPRTLEGDVPMALACGEKMVVLAWDKIATAWSLDTQDEKWTVDLPRPRGEPVTSIGGAATLRCARGSIARGVVHLPALDGKDTKLSLDKGAAL